MRCVAGMRPSNLPLNLTGRFAPRRLTAIRYQDPLRCVICLQSALQSPWVRRCLSLGTRERDSPWALLAIRVWHEYFRRAIFFSRSPCVDTVRVASCRLSARTTTMKRNVVDIRRKGGPPARSSAHFRRAVQRAVETTPAKTPGASERRLSVSSVGQNPFDSSFTRIAEHSTPNRSIPPRELGLPLTSTSEPSGRSQKTFWWRSPDNPPLQRMTRRSLRSPRGEPMRGGL